MKSFQTRWNETRSQLDRTLASDPLLPTELFFFAENMAWIAIEAVNQVCYEKRWGVPSKETSGFDLLTQNQLLTLEEARRLKQMAEYRNLSHRDFTVLDPIEIKNSVQEDLARVEKLFSIIASC